MSTRTEHVRELEAKRSKKRYDNNKEEINRLRRERYAIKHNLPINPVVNPVETIPVINPVVNQVETNPIELNSGGCGPLTPKPTASGIALKQVDNNKYIAEVDLNFGINIPKKVTQTGGKKNLILGGRDPLTPDYKRNCLLIKKLESLDLNPNTKKKYLADLNRILNLINNEDLLTNIRNLNVLTKIKENNTYANSTKLGLIQVILYMITNFKLIVNKKSVLTLKNNFELLKNTINSEHKEKVADPENKIMSFSDYIDTIKSKFGENSKMYVLTKLYNEATLRDDYVLKIVDTTPKDTNENYIVLLKSQLVLIVNTYKTQTAYGQIKIKLSKAVSNLIKKYITTNNLKVGDYLFGDQKLSDFVRYNNKKIDVDGGISNYRKMKISEELLTKDLTAEEKITLAEKMKHSPLVQLKYVRNLKTPVSSEN